MLRAVATKPRISKDSGAASIIMMASASSCAGSVETITLVGIKKLSPNQSRSILPVPRSTSFPARYLPPLSLPQGLIITALDTILSAALRWSLIENDRPLCAPPDTQEAWILVYRHSYISPQHRRQPCRIPASASSALRPAPRCQAVATLCSALREVSLRCAMVLLLSGVSAPAAGIAAIHTHHCPFWSWRGRSPGHEWLLGRSHLAARIS